MEERESKREWERKQGQAILTPFPPLCRVPKILQIVELLTTGDEH